MPTIFNKRSEKAKRRALRKSMPEAEVILWSKLKGRQLAGHKFRRQYSIGPYVVDFYCAQKKLAIELDGDSHFAPGAQERDRKRQKRIEAFEVRFLRFTNNEVRKNLYGVLTAIEEALQDKS